jgi:Xylose isomerase-like TIM barrel
MAFCVRVSLRTRLYRKAMLKEMRPTERRVMAQRTLENLQEHGPVTALALPEAHDLRRTTLLPVMTSVCMTCLRIESIAFVARRCFFRVQVLGRITQHEHADPERPNRVIPNAFAPFHAKKLMGTFFKSGTLEHMQTTPPRRVSLSSWAVHHWLGYALEDSPEHVGTNPLDTSRLLELPAMARVHGIQTLEICHFHLPRFDPERLTDLSETARAHDVQLFSLLIDDGDVSHPQHDQRDRDWIAGWIGLAARLGFERVRVIAGKQDPTPENLERARDHLAHLIALANTLGVRLTVENWLGLFPQPEPLLWMFDQLEGRLGLCLDFGNWHGPTRHADLKRIAHLAESCHAKCEFSADGKPDLEEFRTCLELMRSVDFSGPLTLVHGLESDEWTSLKVQQQALQAFL